MADAPTITPSPYVDPDNAQLIQDFADVLNGRDPSNIAPEQLRVLFDQVVLDDPVVEHPNVQVTDFTVKTAHGNVKTFIFRPKNLDDDLPFVYHLHGGAFFLGDAKAYTPFLSDLVERTGLAFVFPEYTLAPQRTFPVQQEQCVEVLQYLIQHGRGMHLAVDKVVITCDSAGDGIGQLSAAVNIINRQKELNLPIEHQIMISPIVTLNSLFGTFSEWVFQDGPLLNNALIAEGVKLYIPDAEDRTTITASPILMTAQEAKEFMPSTTVLTSQIDPLRDQGQNFAQLLQQAGVACGVVQSVASLHDYVVFNQAAASHTADLVKILIAGKITEVLTATQTKAVVQNGSARGKQGNAVESSRPVKRKRT